MISVFFEADGSELEVKITSPSRVCSNHDWVNPHDTEARVTKMKDGRTHLGYKDEHAVDLDTGAILSVTVQPADMGDCQSLPATLEQAQASLIAIREPQMRETRPESGIEEAVTDKGYHSDEVLRYLADKKIRTYISEPQRKRNWKGKSAEKKRTHANRRRIRGRRGKQLLRRRGELVERPFAHRLERGRLRRVHVRGRANVQKQELMLAAAQNLSLLLRQKYGAGTPRQGGGEPKLTQQAATGLLGTLWVLLSALWATLKSPWRTELTPRGPYELTCAA